MAPTLVHHDQHYVAADAEAAVAAALAALGGAGTALRVEDLAALDQFHTGGLQATRALAEHLVPTTDDHILDVGGGLGGPARLLAQTYGCQVTVVDLTAAYCRIGALLTARVGLADQVTFRQADAQELPYPDASFDLAWTQHSSMNIADKARLYAEIARVLRPGGRLALFEVVAGSGEPLHYPTMWARDAAASFLTTAETLRATLAAAGLQERDWQDRTAWALEWMQRRQAAPPPSSAPNALGLQLLLGPELGTMLRNHARNLEEGRIRIVEAIVARPAAAAQPSEVPHV